MNNAKSIFKKIFHYSFSAIIVATAAFLLYNITCYSIKYIRVNHTLDLVEEYNLSLLQSIENIEESITTEHGYTEKKILYTSYNKTYMDYTSITDTTSPQWNLLYTQKAFTITVDGYLMTDDGYYAVAMGSYFGGIGSKYIVITDKGNVIPVCILDRKKDEHTDSYHFMATQSNDVIEFVIDSSKMKNKVYNNGLIYGGNFNSCSQFAGTIVKIIVIEEK